MNLGGEKILSSLWFHMSFVFESSHVQIRCVEKRPCAGALGTALDSTDSSFGPTLPIGSKVDSSSGIRYRSRRTRTHLLLVMVAPRGEGGSVGGLASSCCKVWVTNPRLKTSKNASLSRCIPHNTPICRTTLHTTKIPVHEILRLDFNFTPLCRGKKKNCRNVDVCLCTCVHRKLKTFALFQTPVTCPYITQVSSVSFRNFLLFCRLNAVVETLFHFKSL